jgi:hypothetical protein
MEQFAQMNKVVVAYPDGRRLKGYVFNFSALRDSFQLFPDEKSRHEEGKTMLMNDLMAVFFVKDFMGNSGYKEVYDWGGISHGRKVEVDFPDGETIAGSTEGYNPKKPGFFLFPANPLSNNIRIFVLNKNVKVRMV